MYVSNIRRLIPGSFFFLLTLLLYSPGIFFGKIFLDFDSLTEAYPYASYFSKHPFAWMQAQYSNGYHSGVNLAFNLDNNLFGWLLSIKPDWIPTFAFLHLVMAAFVFFFAICTYIFFRDRGFSPLFATALTSLVVYSERYVVTLSSWLWVAMYFVFPAFCIILLRLRRHCRLKTALAGGLLGAIGVLFGQPAGLITLSIPLIAYGIFLFYELFREEQRKAWKFLGACLGMVCITLALSGWYLLPVFRLAQDTPRAEGIPFSSLQEEVIRFTDLPRLFFPGWTLYSSGEATLYSSILGFFFFVLSIFRQASSTEERFWRWLAIGTILFALPLSPLAWIANHFPVFKSIRAPDRMLFATVFAVAYLAGCGMRWFLAQEERLATSRVFRWVSRAFLVISGGFLVGVILDIVGGFQILERVLIRWFDKFYYPHTVGLPLEHYHLVLRSMIEGVQMNFSFTNPVTLIVFLSQACVLMLIGVKRIRRPYFIAGAIIVTSSFFALSKFLPVQQVKAQTFLEIPKTAKFILSQPEHERHRIFTLFFGSSKFELLDTPALGKASPEDQVAYAKDLLAVNTNLIYGVQSIDGYDNFMTRRTSNLLNEVMSEAMPTGHRLARSKISRAEKIHLFLDRLPLLSMMNVKYILSAYPLLSPALKEVWSGETTTAKIPVYIYENPSVLPRVYIATHPVILSRDEISTLKELLKPGRNFNTETLLECDGCSIQTSAAPPLRDQLKLLMYRPGYVELQVENLTSQLVVLNENFLRGWKADVDGKDTPIYFANYLYQGVIVEPGLHRLTFRYDKP